jgi:predicted transcriptional regulator
MSLHAYGDHFTKEKIRDIMNEDFRYVTDDTSVSDMVQVMIGEEINELPVVDENRKVIGEVNMLEAVAYYVRLLRKGQGT